MPVLVDRLLLPPLMPDARVVLYIDALPVRLRPRGAAREDHTTVDISNSMLYVDAYFWCEDGVMSGVQEEDHMYVDERVQQDDVCIDPHD